MAVFDLILIGLAVTVEPIPITGFILVLSSNRGTKKGASYIAGWLLSLVVVVVATVAVTGGKPPKPATEPSTAVLAIKIAFGVALLVLAFHRRRQTPKPRKPATWMTKVDGMSVWAAAPLGLLLQPWVLVGAGAATVAQLHISTIESYLLLVLFCLLCTSSILCMEVYAVRSPEAARQRMDGLHGWIDGHRDQVIVILALIVGFWLIGDNLYLVVS
jgi:hypothetical protein